MMTADNQDAFSPKLKAQQRAKRNTARKAEELNEMYREVKQKYPKVWKDLTGFLSRRIESHNDSINRRVGAQIDPVDPNKLRVVPLTNEQVVTLLDKRAEDEVVLTYLEQKVAIKK